MKKKTWIWIIGGILVLAIIGSLTRDEEEAIEDTVTSSDELVETNESEEVEAEPVANIEETSTADDGDFLDVSLTDLQNILRESGFSITKGNPVDGMDNWISTGSNDVIQILADGDRVHSASVTFVLDLQSPSAEGMGKAQRFIHAIHPEAGENIAREIGQESFAEDWKENESVGDVKFEMSYVRIDETVGAFTVNAVPRW